MRKINTKAAKPATAKPAANVSGKPAAKPVAADKPDRQAVINECREAVAKHYNEASLSVHSKRPCAAAVYIERIAKPVQKCGPAGTSTRDESLLALIASKADKAGTFDPVAIAADAGVISRLASVGFISLNSDKQPVITTTGSERARLAAKRVA
jgi:hypothetical protein